MARERAERNGTSNGNLEPNVGSAVPDLSDDEIRELIALMDASDLEEIAIEHRDGLKLVLRKPAFGVATGAGSAAAPLEIESDGRDGATLEEQTTTHGKSGHQPIEIGSPLVGIYRARVKPDDKPLVRPGDIVHEGQIVAAVEALNYVNEIESAASGRVKQIFVRDGQPVEYGQALLSVEPS